VPSSPLGNMPSFSCTDPLLPWKLCPSSSCMDLPLSLGECALLLLLLSLLHELNLSLEKSDSSPSRSSSPQSVFPLSLKCCLYEILMCNSSNPWSPLSVLFTFPLRSIGSVRFSSSEVLLHWRCPTCRSD
jgi:hypothetical protein